MVCGGYKVVAPRCPALPPLCPVLCRSELGRARDKVGVEHRVQRAQATFGQRERQALLPAAILSITPCGQWGPGYPLGLRDGF
jgi:hypothetical protein